MYKQTSRAPTMRSFISSKHRLIRALRFLSNSGFVIFLYFAVFDSGAGSSDILKSNE